MMVKVEMYTDGACSGNPGPGGWGVVLLSGDRQKEISGGAESTTNNAMELQAVLEGLRALKRACQVTVVTDSQNVIGWLGQGWKCRKSHLVKLRNAIHQEIKASGHTVEYQKVKGHSGDPLNDLADALATEAIPS